MKDIEFTVSDIKDLMNTFSKNKLGSMRIEQGGFKLKLEAYAQAGAVAPASGAIFVTEGTSAVPAPFDAETVEEKLSGNIVKSPIVGTFYAAPAPDKAPFVKVGSKVKKGDVLFIIESMKLMNEVTSEFSGVVKEIFVQNGTAVEYGQPIISIE